MKYVNNWHLLTKEEVLDKLSVDVYKGLSREEVKKRRHRYGPNSVWRVRRTSASEAAIAAVLDPTTLILIISAAAAAFFDKKYEAGAIAAILVVAGIMRALTYIRANRILEDMAKEKIPAATVIRDGKALLASASEIVVGDIIFLDAGDTVPCDGRVITGVDSVVSERGITENKTPVHKFDTMIETNAKSGEVPCEFRSNMLFAGSVVISGSLRIAATACGSQTLISMKQGGVSLEPAGKIGLIEKLGERSRNTGLVMLACVMLFTVLSIFSGDVSLPDVFLCTMSMAVAAMSEFLTTIGYIIIAVSLRDSADGKSAEKTGESRAVIREPVRIGNMSEIGRIVFCGSSFFKSGRSELLAYRSCGEYVGIEDQYPADNSPDRLLGLALAASSASIGGGITAHGQTVRMNYDGASEFADITVKAAEAYMRRSGMQISHSYSAADHVDSSAANSSGVDTSLVRIDDAVCAVSCGKIDDIMRCCTTYETKDGSAALDDEIRRRIFTECANLEFGGAKVIAVAMRSSQFSSLNRISVLTQYMKFVGFFAISQEYEKNAAQNVDYLKKSGVVPIMFSENPDGDLYYCHRLKLFNKKTKMIHVSALTPESAAEIGSDGAIVSFEGIERSYLAGAYSRAMKTIMISGRSDDESDNENVMITAAVGRESRESGVLSKADIGFAVSQSKFRTVPEVLAKNSSVVVHPAPDVMSGCGGLDGTVRAMRESRRTIDNIDSAKFYLTSSQVARLTLILAAVLFDIPLLPPVFILIWGLIFDFAAVLVMAFERGDGQPVTKKNADGESSKPTVISLVYGVLWGIILALLVPIADRLSPGIIGVGGLSAAAVLSALAASVIVMKRGTVYISKARSSTALIIYCVMSIIFSLVLMFTGIGSDISGGSTCGAWTIVPAAVPSLLITALSSVPELAGILRKNGDVKNRGDFAKKE